MKNEIQLKQNKIISFESISGERVQETVNRIRTDNRDHIYRAEIVLTEKCNLSCSYCQKRLSIEEHEERISKQLLMKNIKMWAKAGCEYIHYTGGEPTLIEYLPELVKLTSDLGIRPIITSNATSDVNIYQRLVENGLYGIHISLDTNEAEKFDGIVGVKGSFLKVIDTIREVTRLRDEENYDVHVTLNSTVTPNTINKLVSMLQFYLSLKPDDIKLMPIAQLREKWSDYSDMYYKNLYPELKNLIPEHPDKFVMLRNRIAYLVENKVRGYHNEKP